MTAKWFGSLMLSLCLVCLLALHASAETYRGTALSKEEFETAFAEVLRLCDTNEFEKAVEACDKIVETSAADWRIRATALGVRTQLYWRIRESAERAAHESFLAAAKLYPDSPEFLRPRVLLNQMMAEMLLEARRFDEARELLMLNLAFCNQPGIEVRTRDVVVPSVFLLAQYYAAVGKAKEGASFLRELPGKYGESLAPPCLYYRALLLATTGEVEVTAKALEEAIENSPEGNVSRQRAQEALAAVRSGKANEWMRWAEQLLIMRVNVPPVSTGVAK